MAKEYLVAEYKLRDHETPEDVYQYLLSIRKDDNRYLPIKGIGFPNEDGTRDSEDLQYDTYHMHTYDEIRQDPDVVKVKRFTKEDLIIEHPEWFFA